MNVLEKLAELTTKTGDLTDELLKFRASRANQENFTFSFSEPDIEVQIPFKIGFERPIFVGIRNLILRKNIGASASGQSISISFSNGQEEVRFDINSSGGVALPSLIDATQFSTYFFPDASAIGQEIFLTLFIRHQISANNFSLLSQGESSFFVTYI